MNRVLTIVTIVLGIFAMAVFPPLGLILFAWAITAGAHRRRAKSRRAREAYAIAYGKAYQKWERDRILAYKSFGA